MIPPSSPDAGRDFGEAGAPRRPFALSLAAWAFVLVGGGGILRDVLSLVVGPPPARQALLAEGAPMLAVIWGVRGLAVVGGLAALEGQRWSRWLLLAWMLFHVWISLQHSLGMALAHVAIFAVLGWALVYPPSERFFRGRGRGART